MRDYRDGNLGSVRAHVQQTDQLHHRGGITLIRFNGGGEMAAQIGEGSDPDPMGRLQNVVE